MSNKCLLCVLILLVITTKACQSQPTTKPPEESVASGGPSISTDTGSNGAQTPQGLQGPDPADLINQNPDPGTLEDRIKSL